jgi:predicted DNA binding CopG/RHH family protein
VGKCMSKRSKQCSSDSPPRYTAVNTRLFAEDVLELKRRALAEGATSWQAMLRLLVHTALRRVTPRGIAQ